MPLIVHHLGTSQSERIPFLCEELKIPYELKIWQRDPFLAPPEFKKLHPAGAAPLIEDTDAGVKLAESEACMEYINQIYGHGALSVKPGEPGYADYLYWLAFTNGTLQPLFGRVMTLTMSGHGAEDGTKQRLTAKANSCLQAMDEHLGQNAWLAGDKFSTADIMIMFTLTTMRKFVPWDLSEFKHVLAYMRKIAGRQAYQRAMKKADPELDIESLLKGETPELQAALKTMIMGKT